MALILWKIGHKAIKNMGLGSGIRKKTYTGSRIKGPKGTGSRIRIRNTAQQIENASPIKGRDQGVSCC
jgi:hypothetical protein